MGISKRGRLRPELYFTDLPILSFKTRALQEKFAVLGKAANVLPRQLGWLRRRSCLRCRRPLAACYCTVVKPFESKPRFVILTHRKEAKHSFGTGRMAYLCIRNALRIEGADFSEDETTNRMIQDPDLFSVVLYPGPGATNLSMVPAPRAGGTRSDRQGTQCLRPRWNMEDSWLDDPLEPKFTSPAPRLFCSSHPFGLSHRASLIPTFTRPSKRSTTLSICLLQPRMKIPQSRGHTTICSRYSAPP